MRIISIRARRVRFVPLCGRAFGCTRSSRRALAVSLDNIGALKRNVCEICPTFEKIKGACSSRFVARKHGCLVLRITTSKAYALSCSSNSIDTAFAKAISVGRGLCELQGTRFRIRIATRKGRLLKRLGLVLEGDDKDAD